MIALLVASSAIPEYAIVVPGIANVGDSRNLFSSFSVQ